MAFTIKLEPEAHQDIQKGIEWYNEQQPGMGNEFHTECITSFEILKTNPFFQIRYDNVRCLPLRTYPLIHFTVDEKNKIVIVRAIFNTLRDPKIWKKRT